MSHSLHDYNAAVKDVGELPTPDNCQAGSPVERAVVGASATALLGGWVGVGRRWAMANMNVPAHSSTNCTAS